MLKNRWYKNTLGVQAECIIAQALDTSNTSAPQATFDAFSTTAPAGSIAVYWTDTKALVANGATAVAANANRTLFYAWKQADGTVMVSTPIPANLKYTSVAYNAGQPDIVVGTFGGTISVGQTIYVTIIETTAVAIPYPKYQYEAKVTTDVATALGKIAAAINAEKDSVASATASGTGLTVTGLSGSRTLKVIATIGITFNQPTDASAISFSVTQKAIAPLGTTADVKEFEEYFLEQNGAIIYSPMGGVKISEFQTQASNVVNGINYGYLVVTANKSERGEVRNFNQKAYTIIAAPAAAVSALAAK